MNTRMGIRHFEGSHAFQCDYRTSPRCGRRIERWPNDVGRENLIFGNDCGFKSTAGNSEIPITVAWAKLKALGVMSACDNDTLFVRDGDRMAIVTGMNLSKVVVLQRARYAGERPVPLRHRLGRAA